MTITRLWRPSTALSIIATALAVAVALTLVARPVEAAAGVTAATGGGAISADTAKTGGTGVATTLGPITIAEDLAGDIALGTGVTLIVTAPTGFEFTAQIPSVSGLSTDLTALAMSFPTLTTMQLTLTSAATTIVDSVVIGATASQEIQVRPLSGTPLATGNIVRTTANPGTATITGIDLDITNFGTLTEVAGAASKLAVTTQPSASTVAGVAFATQPIVTVQDQFGNTTGDTSTVTLGLTTGTGTLSGTTSMAAVAGVADFVSKGLSIDLVGTNKVLTASATSRTSATTSAFTITHAAASKLALTTQPSASTAPNVAFAQQPIVTIQDTFGNTVTTDNTTVVTAALFGGTGTLAGTKTKIAAVGIASFAGNNMAIDLTGTNKVLRFTSSPVLTQVDSAAFTIAVPVASATTSTITASRTSFTVNGVGSTITVQLKDAGSANLTTGGDTVVLSTDMGTLSAVTDNADGTYKATLTSSTSGTATITGTVNAATITDTATVTVNAISLPPTPPTAAGLGIAVENVMTVPASATAEAVVSSLASGGSAGKVTVPAAALPDGSTVTVGAIKSLTELTAKAQTPAGVGLLVGFSITAKDAAGVAVTSNFSSPVNLEFTVAATSLPAGAGAGELRIAFWNGSAWVPLTSTVTVNADGTATISATTEHFSVFSVVYDAAGFGRISGEVPASGFSIVTFGGSTAELETALVAAGCSRPAFTTNNGAWVSFLANAPFAAINADFNALFSEGVPLGRGLIINNCS